MSKRYKIILILLIVIIAISSYFIIKEFVENKKEIELYEDLQDIVTGENNEDTNFDEEQENSSDNYNLESIAEINADIVGWIKIEGTNIDYPVMQNGNYYLHRNIYKEYSSHGTPYLAEYCNIQYSDNLIIYGHNMKDNSMFSQLVNYKSYNFYKDHSYIKFYTIKDGKTVENTYEIISVFKTVVYSDEGFKYYNYTTFYDEEEFNYFIKKCNELELYNIDTETIYGDKFITLSTCEYSQKNGRMIIVAKKI